MRFVPGSINIVFVVPRYFQGHKLEPGAAFRSCFCFIDCELMLYNALQTLVQWLALTPPELVKAHLQLSDETIAHLSKEKPVIVAPQP